MSWVYWGIVTGLVALVAMLVVCIDILSTNGQGDAARTIRNTGGSTDANKQASAGDRLAA